MGEDAPLQSLLSTTGGGPSQPRCVSAVRQCRIAPRRLADARPQGLHRHPRRGAGPEATIAYETYGRLAPDGRNAILCTHGYTGSLILPAATGRTATSRARGTA